MNNIIKHCPEVFRFEIEISGEKAYVEYEESANNINITHTFVPNKIAGRGIAAQLTEQVIQYANSCQKHLHATCAYAVNYLKQHAN